MLPIWRILTQSRGAQPQAVLQRCEYSVYTHVYVYVYDSYHELNFAMPGFMFAYRVKINAFLWSSTYI